MELSKVYHQEPVKSNQRETITYTEALKLTRFGKFNCLLIFLTGLILTNRIFESIGLGFILPIAQCELRLSNEEKGLLGAINSAGMIISFYPWGFLADTLGRRKIIKPTLIAGFLATLFSSFAHTFWIMLLLRFLNGLFISGGSATIFAYLGEFHTNKTRARAVMGSSIMVALGAMMLPALAYMVVIQDWLIPLPFLGIDYKPWRLFVVLCAFPGLISGLLLCVLPESPKFLLSKGRVEEANAALMKVHRWNGGADEELNLPRIILEEDTISKVMSDTNSNFAARLLHTMWHQTALLFNRKYLRTTLIVCQTQFWLIVVAVGLCFWFPHITNIAVEFMDSHPGESKHICDIVYETETQEALTNSNATMSCITKLENKTYYYSVIMDVFYISVYIFTGLIVNRVGKIPIIFVFTIIFTSCGLSVVFITDLNVAIYMYVLYFIVGSVINLLNTTTVELYPTHLRGMAICLSMMMGSLGAVFGSNITGALLSHYCEWTFYISAGALFYSAFLVLCLPKKQPEDLKKENIES